MPILVKLAIDAICGVLNSLGGFHFLWMRRYIMPFVLAIAASIQLHILWIGLVVLPVIGTLCLGYFGKGSHFGRGLWLFLQSLVIGIGLLLTGHIYWYFFLPYIVISGVLGGSLVNLFQPIGDFIEGFWLGSIILLIH